MWEVTLAEEFDTDDPPLDGPCRLVDGYLCWMQPISATSVRLVSSHT